MPLTDPEKKRKYQREYWRKNAEKRKEQKRTSYGNNLEESRRKAREHQKAWREKRKAADVDGSEAKRRKEAGIYKSKMTQLKPKKYEVLVKGRRRDILMYNVGGFAKVLMRRAEAIKRAEERGLMPKPLYYAENGRRLYTKDQAQAAWEIFNKAGWPWHWGKSAIPAKLKKAWAEMPDGIKVERQRK